MASHRRDFDRSEFDDSFMDDEDVDPRSSVANLADVMLVFACGLMVALVAHWNINISTAQEVEADQSVTEINDVEEMVDSATNGGGYVDMGRVYQDSATGKMYVITENPEQETADSSTTGTSEESSGAAPTGSSGGSSASE